MRDGEVALVRQWRWGVLLPLHRILKLNQCVFRETRDKTEAEMN
jgi:hypothetical protein